MTRMKLSIFDVYIYIEIEIANGIIFREFSTYWFWFSHFTLGAGQHLQFLFVLGYIFLLIWGENGSIEWYDRGDYLVLAQLSHLMRTPKKQRNKEQHLYLSQCFILSFVFSKLSWPWFHRKTKCYSSWTLENPGNLELSPNKVHSTKPDKPSSDLHII